ncbi:uncharacterized protein LOC123515016 isoform X2 [Portunus trituberculatus]|uniref:uncharacterized protein LOC123515016 isoform X2 n=2 Tax=Portunus trituberculatus TaxID=210409 RepID=UPI001E1D0D5E|nr:uncharacterized protein LOC123515016 isoform X2 [Portunus trituberculatus]
MSLMHCSPRAWTVKATRAGRRSLGVPMACSCLVEPKSSHPTVWPNAESNQYCSQGEEEVRSSRKGMMRRTVQGRQEMLVWWGEAEECPGRVKASECCFAPRLTAGCLKTSRAPWTALLSTQVKARVCLSLRCWCGKLKPVDALMAKGIIMHRLASVFLPLPVLFNDGHTRCVHPCSPGCQHYQHSNTLSVLI